MRALYSLVCRLRTLYALVRGIMTFLSGGWTALGPAQLLVLGLLSCVTLRVLIPSPPSGRGKAVTCADHLFHVAAAVSLAGLAVVGFADSCSFLTRLLLLALP